MALDELDLLLDRANRFRDEALHLQNMISESRGISVATTPWDPPYITYTSSVNTSTRDGCSTAWEPPAYVNSRSRAVRS